MTSSAPAFSPRRSQESSHVHTPEYYEEKDAQDRLTIEEGEDPSDGLLSSSEPKSRFLSLFPKNILAHRTYRPPLRLTSHLVTSALLLFVMITAYAMFVISKRDTFIGRSYGNKWVEQDEELRQFSVLESACAGNDWRPGLWVNCTLSMGMNNLRGEFGTCVKFAFDAGAGLVIPPIVLRDPTTLSAWDEHRATIEAGHYFDTEQLKKDLGRWCPQMGVRDTYDAQDIKLISDIPREWWALRFKAGTYREHFDQVLANNSVNLEEYRAQGIGLAIKETLRPYSVWDYRSHPPMLTNAFFSLIRFAPRLVEAGKQIVSFSPLDKPYLGVHLRLEKDTFNYWNNFDSQTGAYDYHIKTRPEKIIYLACGENEWKEKFRARFPNHTVVDKWDLVKQGTPLYETLGNMTFDEMSVMDYIPMLNAELVMGIGVSSFAYLLGVDRREDRDGYFSDYIQPDKQIQGDPLVGDSRTQLQPFVLPEYWNYFP